MTATLGVVKTFAELSSYALSETPEGVAPRLAAALGAGGSLADVTALGLQQIGGQMQRAAQAGLMSAGAAENLASRLTTVGTGLARVGSALGAGGALIGTYLAAEEAWKNPSVGTVGAALGSAVSAAGAVATLLGANTLGGPLVWAGTAIGLGAWAYQAASDNRTYLREGAQLLTPHVGGDAAMAQALMSTSRLAELGAAGLSAQQIRDGVARLEGEAPGMASLAAQIIQRSGAPADEAAAFLAQASPAWIQSIAAQLTPGLGSVSTGSPEELRRAMADAVRAAQ